MDLSDKPVLCVGITPGYQRVMEFDQLRVGEVNRARKVTRFSSGKGVNVAILLKELGTPAHLCGFLGGHTGEAMAQDLETLGIQHGMVFTSSLTRHTQTIIDRSTGGVTELVDEASPNSEDEWSQFHASFDHMINQSSVVTISGNLPPDAPDTLYEDLTGRAKAVNVPTIIDSSRGALLESLQHQPFLAKMALHELADTFEAKVDSEDKVMKLMKSLVEKGALNVLLTRGHQPALLCFENTFYRYMPPRVTVLNPIGSGDCVTAGIIHELRQGASLPDAVTLGIACGTVNATTLTPMDVKKDDVYEMRNQVVMEQLD